jgi:hypothetical protein
LVRHETSVFSRGINFDVGGLVMVWGKGAKISALVEKVDGTPRSE